MAEVSVALKCVQQQLPIGYRHEGRISCGGTDYYCDRVGWRVWDSDSAQNYFVNVLATTVMALVALPHPA